MKLAEETITVIGLGNTMAGDDGVGPWIVRRLAEAAPPARARVEWISAPGPEMVDLLDAEGEVWFIDAARAAGMKAGEIIERRVVAGDDAALAPAQHLVSTHGLSLAELLLLARALGRWRATVRLLGVVGERFEAGEGLSPEVERAAERLALRLLDELTA